ncbi:hypothetical protein ACG7TL_003413 [Trametes sanguinea]
MKISDMSVNKDLGPTPSVQGQASTPLSGTSKTIVRSRKASGKMTAIWPPALGVESLKDRCARVWARQPENLSKTQEDFDIWYKQAAHYKKKKLANQDSTTSHVLPAADAPEANGTQDLDRHFLCACRRVFTRAPAWFILTNITIVAILLLTISILTITVVTVSILAITVITIAVVAVATVAVVTVATIAIVAIIVIASLTVTGIALVQYRDA